MFISKPFDLKNKNITYIVVNKTMVKRGLSLIDQWMSSQKRLTLIDQWMSSFKASEIPSLGWKVKRTSSRIFTFIMFTHKYSGRIQSWNQILCINTLIGTPLWYFEAHRVLFALFLGHLSHSGDLLQLGFVLCLVCYM